MHQAWCLTGCLLMSMTRLQLGPCSASLPSRFLFWKQEEKQHMRHQTCLIKTFLKTKTTEWVTPPTSNSTAYIARTPSLSPLLAATYHHHHDNRHHFCHTATISPLLTTTFPPIWPMPSTSFATTRIASTSMKANIVTIHISISKYWKQHKSNRRSKEAYAI